MLAGELRDRITQALGEAGVLDHVDGTGPPVVHLPEPELPDGPVLGGADPEPGGDVVMHVHLGRVEVVHPAPAPPPVRRPDPPVRRRATPPVDHDAYLARRRADRR